MKTRLWTRCVVAISLLVVASSAQATVTFDWATVGDAGNADDTHGDGYGGVAHEYRISTTEVTNAQYVEFLNDVAATDPYGLYSIYMNGASGTVVSGITRSGLDGSYTYAVNADAVGLGPGGSDYTYANKPVGWVSWYDSIRFINWLTSGTTESGTYTITGGGANSGTVTTPDHTTLTGGEFFMPTEDEWYKAAYYDGSVYYDYATGTDSLPDNNLSSADSGNSVNHRVGSTSDEAYTTGHRDYPMTDVGDYTMSPSPYGTFDQNGNAFEWSETAIGTNNPPSRGNRGGSSAGAAFLMKASFRSSNGPTLSSNGIGFRVGSLVPSAPACIIGDANCDGYVDIAGDILAAFTNFSGPGSFGRTRIQGDVHGPIEPCIYPGGCDGDGDVDVQDLLTMFGNFTGPAPDGSGGLVAADAGDANIPDLIYDAATGEVTLDVDESGIIGYVLKNGDNSFVFGNHQQILAGLSTSLANELSEAAFASSVGANSLGNVFPLGMDLATLTAYLTVNDVSRSLGAPVVPFDLVVLSTITGPAVPEPATVLLSVFGLVGLGFIAYRRRVA